MTEHNLLESIANAVLEMSKDHVTAGVQAALAAGLAPLDIIQQGLAPGMQRMGKRFASGECFVPEVLLASKALYAGLDLVQPHLPAATQDTGVRVVLGVVAGDVHDIGKNIVKLMWSTAGFAVVDLGKNVKEQQFIEAVRTHKPQVLAISTLMSPTIQTMKRTIQGVKDAGLAKDLTIIVGGAPLNEDLARDMGADLYGADADAAVRLLQQRFAVEAGA